MSFSPEWLARSLAALEPNWRLQRLAVACSGGLDSTALLHALAALRDADGLPLLRALTVDHGLQPDSADWTLATERLCRTLGVPHVVLRAAGAPARGASLEAWARDARYAALGAALSPGEALLTAHHQDDQLETVLIQLLRGAGVAGLAAMPERNPLGAGSHWRPLLGTDREAIHSYAVAAGISWIRDPMNEDRRYDRGYLRETVLPALKLRWPAAAATVARSAAHLAEARNLLATLAAADAAGMVDQGRLELAGFCELPRDRQVNVLRWWIHECGLRPPPAARLASALETLQYARPDALPLIRWQGGELRRYRGRLYAMAPLPEPPVAHIELRPSWQDVPLGPGLGRFALVGDGGGRLAEPGDAVSIRFRAGGESLRPHGRPQKRLKDLCQEAGVVPWMRNRLPLVFFGPRLAAVGDLWIAAEFAARPGEPALRPVWNDRPPLF